VKRISCRAAVEKARPIRSKRARPARLLATEVLACSPCQARQAWRRGVASRPGRVCPRLPVGPGRRNLDAAGLANCKSRPGSARPARFSFNPWWGRGRLRSSLLRQPRACRAPSRTGWRFATQSAWRGLGRDASRRAPTPPKPAWGQAGFGNLTH